MSQYFKLNSNSRIPRTVNLQLTDTLVFGKSHHFSFLLATHGIDNAVCLSQPMTPPLCNHNS